MDYYFSKKVDINFDDAIESVIDELKKEGFGILTDIDVKAVLKKKIDADFRNYRILGACNPHLAHKALLSEEMVGLMLPCNVIVLEGEDGTVEVAAIDPMKSMMAIDNSDLEDIAVQARDKLRTVIDRL